VPPRASPLIDTQQQYDTNNMYVETACSSETSVSIWRPIRHHNQKDTSSYQQPRRPKISKEYKIAIEVYNFLPIRRKTACFFYCSPEHRCFQGSSRRMHALYAIQLPDRGHGEKKIFCLSYTVTSDWTLTVSWLNLAVRLSNFFEGPDYYLISYENKRK